MATETVSERINKLIADRNRIRNKLINFGLSESTDKLEDLASDIESIVNRGSVSATVKEGESYTIEAGYHKGGTVQGVAGGGNYTLENKGSIEPTKAQQIITPSAGYYGISGLTVLPIPAAYQDVTSVTATANDVLSPKKIVRPDGSLVSGNITTYGRSNELLSCGQNTEILAGYYPNKFTVYALGLPAQTEVDEGYLPVTSVQMLPGYQGWVRGAKVSGGMPNTEMSIVPSVMGSKSTVMYAEVDEEELENYPYKLVIKAKSTITKSGYAEKDTDFYTDDEDIKTYVILNQDKTVTPSSQAQIVVPDTDGDGIPCVLSSVTVNPVQVDSSNSFNTNGTKTAASGKFFSSVVINVPTGTARNADSVTVSENVVNIPAGLYSSFVTKTIPEATPASGTITGLGTTAGDSVYTIPAGYHDGTGTVSLTNDILTELQKI